MVNASSRSSALLLSCPFPYSWDLSPWHIRRCRGQRPDIWEVSPSRMSNVSKEKARHNLAPPLDRDSGCYVKVEDFLQNKIGKSWV